MNVPLPVDVQTLHNLKRGDVIWVHVAPGEATDQFLEALREAILTEVEESVAVLITPSDFVKRVSVMSLVDLLAMREQFDAMIESKLASMEHFEG